MPFDPVHKRTEATIKVKDGNQLKVTKGAPQAIMELPANAPQVKQAIENAVNEFAACGFRVLGVARADGEGAWQFIGICPYPTRHGKKRRPPLRPRARWG